VAAASFTFFDLAIHKPSMIICSFIIIIISASLYERSAYATGLSRGPSVCPHM